MAKSRRNLRKTPPSCGDQDWSPWIEFDIEGIHKKSSTYRLMLSISFDSHHKRILGGRFWFGLRGGELALTALNARMPKSSRWPKKQLDSSILVRRTSKSASGQTTDVSDSSSISVGKGISGQTGRQTKKSTKRGTEDSVEFERTEALISSKGSETNAYWDFSTGAANDVLRGELASKQITQLIGDGKPYGVRAELNIYKRDIRPLDVEGFFIQTVSKLQEQVIYAILRRHIHRRMGRSVYKFELSTGSKDRGAQ